ncbi:MAG: tyrosine-protein phosphatase [Planctomycetes bacterium]|nr:tyrosine-protein phosphatase [Planctomycetota bacterium]
MGTRSMLTTFLALLTITASVGCGSNRTRHVDLDGQPNFRDLGGYETASGRTVKWGLVYRSGELPRLTDDDVERLETLELSTVISFLTEAEVAYRGSDRVPEGVHEVALPIDTEGELVQALIDARKTGDFSLIPPELNVEIHTMLPQEAARQYAELLRALADEDVGPVVFHCSHGVHRTGTASAILLWALGVPWETIREDYLLSNRYRREEVATRLDQLRQLAARNQGIDPADVDTTNIEAFYILDGSYIDATRDAIQSEYGSIFHYLRAGLGLSRSEIKDLRNRLLK